MGPRARDRKTRRFTVPQSLIFAALLLVYVYQPLGPSHAGKCAPGIIMTIAGTELGPRGLYCGDRGPAVRACLGAPYGIAFGPGGSLFVADRLNNRIRKVDTAGIITTVAGNGRWGYAGDGGPATEAQLAKPRAVATSADGSVYVADTGNHRIRKISPDGTVTTVAGNGWKDADGEGRYSGDGGPATHASLASPWGVAVGADGSLCIADANNHRIRKVDPKGIITTVAGDGWSQTVGEGEMAYTEGRFAGDGGPATEASLDWPPGVAVAPDGALYIADCRNHRIRKVDQMGVIATVVGTGEHGFSGDGGPATKAQLSGPTDVAFGRDGSLYIADYGNRRVRKVNPEGIITTVAGNGLWKHSGDGGLAVDASFRAPSSIALDAHDNLYVVDSACYRIRKICNGKDS